MKKVLLTTVCGPFGADTDDCTRHTMPELFHAQVTRAQGIFSPRSTYISYGLEYMAENLTTPTTVLQYPTMKQFEHELKKGYDFVGISFVIATFGKLKKMSAMAREVAPNTKIILGGYGTTLSECEQYGDHVCRGEGVDFMRQLLGETHGNTPHKHVQCLTKMSVAGIQLQKGAVVLAGLGCPHGCEFCASSHFHKMKHIPLIHSGLQLHQEIGRAQKTLGRQDVTIGVIEEDFLLQKKRALEYLDCVKKDPKSQVRISCFASANSVAQWDPKDLVRMGIDTVWIGVESKKAGYTKLKGIDVKSVFEGLHTHGINTLASLIIGHDFHTVASVQEDVDYLVSLNPSLSQILIMSPACATPLFDRFKKDGRMLDVPFTHWDGFHLTFTHPHIGKPEMEQLLLDVYDDEFRRLGPSPIRVIEKKLNGYLMFKNSTDPLLAQRAVQCRQACLEALPLFPTAIRYAPSEAVARWVKTVEQSILKEIGGRSITNKLLTSIVPVLAFVEDFKQKYRPYPQMKLQRTSYRMSEKSLLFPASIGNGILTLKPRAQNAPSHPLVVDLQGAFNRLTAKKLKKRVNVYLKENSGNLAINFGGVTSAEHGSLLMFLKRLKGHKERIKLVSINSSQTGMAEVAAYAKNYFQVFLDVEGLAASCA